LLGLPLKVHSNPTTVLEVLDNENGCDLELLDAVKVKYGRRQGLYAVPCQCFTHAPLAYTSHAPLP
jgi:hypothetical protein